jgi:hypothetical protein
LAEEVEVAREGEALIIGGGVRRRTVRLEGASDQVWELVAGGLTLGALVERLSGEADGGARRLAGEAVPLVRWLLSHRLIEPIAPAGGVL